MRGKIYLTIRRFTVYLYAFYVYAPQIGEALKPYLNHETSKRIYSRQPLFPSPGNLSLVYVCTYHDTFRCITILWGLYSCLLEYAETKIYR